jgi:hypothetical protein
MGRVGATGGLVWHLRARRHRRGLWADYLEYTHQFLADWFHQSLAPAEARRLIIVGASAGWSLPSAWLQRFETLVLIDPDPLAPWLFGRNHPKPAGQDRIWYRGEFQVVLPGLLASGSTPKCRRSAVLFNNLLGQLRLTSQDLDKTESQLGDLKSELGGQHWASFHDRLSGDWGMAQQSAGGRRLQAPIENAALSKTYGLGGEWLDHLTAGVLPTSVPRWIYPWRITPNRLHVVEAGWVEPDQAGTFHPR